MGRDTFVCAAQWTSEPGDCGPALALTAVGIPKLKAMNADVSHRWVEPTSRTYPRFSPAEMNTWRLDVEPGEGCARERHLCADYWGARQASENEAVSAYVTRYFG